MALPNAVRITLLLLTTVSFIPQYMRISARRDCAGISGWYILFNLIVATQQFSLGLAYIVFFGDGDDVLVHNPPSRGDWLNLVQLGVVSGGHLILFGLYLFYPPATPGQKTAVASLFLTFLLVSIVPIIILAILPSEGGVERDRSWPLALFTFFSIYILNPAATVLAITAYLPQAREIRSHSNVGAVSVFGLVLQAAVFLAVGITWDFRWVLPRGMPRFTSTWYEFGGWAVVDNVVFALVQGALWWIEKGVRRDALRGNLGEREPLTGST